MATQAADGVGDKDSARTVHLLDYVAGNVRSLVNAIQELGFSVEWVQHPHEVRYANVRNNRR